MIVIMQALVDAFPELQDHVQQMEYQHAAIAEVTAMAYWIAVLDWWMDGWMDGIHDYHE